MPLFLIATNYGESLTDRAATACSVSSRKTFTVHGSPIADRRSPLAARRSPTHRNSFSLLPHSLLVPQIELELELGFPPTQSRSQDIEHQKVKRAAGKAGRITYDSGARLTAKARLPLQASTRTLPLLSLLPVWQTPADHRPAVEKFHNELGQRVSASKTPPPWLRLSVPW
jgi:hypothetical protein